MLMENVRKKQDDCQDDKPGFPSKKKRFVSKKAIILLWQDDWPQTRMISSWFGPIILGHSEACL